MATLNIYSNNLARKPGQVLIECDPNRTVLKLIEACITKNNSSLSNEDLARWIFLYFVSRIKNHVAKVQACATYLRPFFQQANCGNLFNHFITKVQQHDFDKFSGNEHVTMYALHSTLMMHRGLYKMSDRADKAYHTIELPKHWELNDHHPEHYMKIVDLRKDRWAITDDELDRFYAGHGGYAAIVLAIAEMVADWSAVGLDMGNTAKEWWLKNQGVRWSYGPKYTDLLEECLEHAPTELYVNDVEPLPEAPSVRTISVEDSSPQLSLEAILTGEDPCCSEDLLDGSELSEEKLFISDKETLAAVKSATKVATKTQLATMLKPGDMILTYRKMSKKPLIGKIVSHITSHILGSSFGSIKMVAEDANHVYGYGLKMGLDHVSFDRITVKAFFSTCSGMLILRNPKLTDEQKTRLFAWLSERVNKVDYSNKLLIKSIFTHLLHWVTGDITTEQAKNYFRPMFCSTIFAYAMKACNIETGLSFGDASTVWPRDWAVHSNWKPLYSYIDPAEDTKHLVDFPAIGEKTMASAASYTPEVQGEVSNEGWWGDPVTEQGMYYKIRNFPADQFLARLHKEYGTTRLDHLIQILGITFFVAKTRTIVIHKFFIPELLYLLDKFQFSPSVSDMIRSNTWVGAPVTITQTVDTAYIAKTMNAELYDHQKAFIESYATNRATNHLRGYILSFEQGLGKTITALALMQGLKKDHVVIICPKNTMIETWQNHLTKFFNEPQSVWIAGSSSTPPTAAYKWFIVNYERIEEVSKFLLKSGFSNLGVIVDESHNFLRTSSQRTQLLIDLSKNNKNADILLQSGTPVKCTGIELVPLLYVLDPYFDAEALAIFKRTFKLNTTIANDVLNARLKRMMTRVTKDILDLPEKQEVVVKIKMKTGSKYTVTQVQKDVVEFVKQRRIYYNQHLKEYVAAFEEVINYLKRDPKFSRSANFKRYLRIVDELRNSTTVNVRDNPDIAWANQYEREVIIPALPQDLKKKFLWSKSAVKYVSLKITGEVIGQLLTNLRIQMTSELMVAANLAQYVEGAMKKTVVFTSYVDTIELAYNYFKENGYSPIAIYSKTASELTENVRRFQEDTNLNPLIASLKMLSTGATLTAANTVIFLNKPWRSIEYQQASDRVHRIGQDTDCVIISLVLDTGKEGNLSTRMEDIMNWSADQFQQIVEEQVVDKDELAQVKQLFKGFAGLEYMPDDCIESEYSVEAYDPPYTEEQMRQNGYSEEVIARLKNDNAHAWRMKTGIELIHVEPTKSELMRIWKNWQQMSSSQKKQSDEMCMHLFGQNNKSLYEYLLPQYKTEQPGYGVVRYPFEVMIQGGYVYHASPLKVDKLRGKFTGAWSGEQGSVFVTPYKAITVGFAISTPGLIEEVEKRMGGTFDTHTKNDILRFSYDNWELPPDKLRTVPKVVNITVNVRGLEPFSGESVGYLYTIDYMNKYRGKSHKFNRDTTSDYEFLIEGDVDYVSCEKITIKWTCSEASERFFEDNGEAHVTTIATEAASSDDKTRGPISEADRKKIGKYIYHGTHRDLDIKSLAIHVCKHRANPEITAPVVYMNRTLGVASLHAVPFMIGHGSKLSNYQEHFVNLDEAISSSTPLKQVEIVHNDPSLEECSGETTGYIYWVEAKEFLDDLYYATPKDPNDWNFVAYRPLPVAKKTKVTVKWHKKYDPEFASKVKSGHASVETMLLLSATPQERKLNQLAKPYYVPTGKNSWEHVQQDMGDAVEIVRGVLHRDLFLKEYAAILFHDCSVKVRNNKDDHAKWSAEISRPVLAKTGYFTEEELDEIATAIAEHDENTNPAGTHSSVTSDVLASADFNPPNLAWMLNKSYAWGLAKGLTHEQAIQNVITHMPSKYGSHGSAVMPNLYKQFYKGKIKALQKAMDNLTYDEAERIIMEYRERHHLGEHDFSLPDPSLEVLSYSAEASSSSKIAQKKKKILDYICKLCDTMEPSGVNSKRYQQIIGHMNDKEFDQFMNYMKEGKWQLHIVAPNMVINLKNEDLLKACDLIGLDLFQRVWMHDFTTGRKYLTDNKYMFVKLPVRRQQQFLDEKLSVPDNDRTIDGLTGQVTGDSRACSLTNPEIHILAARGLDHTLKELVNIRGGNIHGYGEFRRMLEENGEGDLDRVDPNSRTRSAVVGGVLLQAMMLGTNL